MDHIDLDYLANYGIVEIKYPDIASIKNVSDTHILPIGICEEIANTKEYLQEEFTLKFIEKIMDIKIEDANMEELVRHQDMLRVYSIKVFKTPLT